jgi:hypothetical protein
MRALLAIALLACSLLATFACDLLTKLKVKEDQL